MKRAYQSFLKNSNMFFQKGGTEGLMIKFSTLEEAKDYVNSYLELNDIEMINLLSNDKESKEFRLSTLLSTRPLISEELMMKYDNNEKAVFTALFIGDFNYAVPTPHNLPNEALNEIEQNWCDRLSRGGIQAAHTLINNNQQVNLVSIKKMYCYMINHGHQFDDKRLLQTFMIIANPFLSDRIKKEECFDSERIFFKTFLPEYYEERYNPLDYLDILYCLNASVFRSIAKKAEIKELESKWEGNKNGILIDEMMFQALNKYMDEKGFTTEQKLKSLTQPDTIVSESPLLSIYYNHKKMVKAAKYYNLKGSIVSQTNEGRWIYYHPLDMFMINLSQTGKAQDRKEAIRTFPYYYHLREEISLASVVCLDVYNEYKDKRQDSYDIQK